MLTSLPHFSPCFICSLSSSLFSSLIFLCSPTSSHLFLLPLLPPASFFMSWVFLMLSPTSSINQSWVYSPILCSSLSWRSQLFPSDRIRLSSYMWPWQPARKQDPKEVFLPIKKSQETILDKDFLVSMLEKSEETWRLNYLRMLIIALTTPHYLCKPQLHPNSQNLAKISPVAEIVICMKYQINFTINYDLCSPYKWDQLERNVFNCYIAFSGKVVPRTSTKLNTCCVGCIHSNNHFLLKHSPCLVWSAALNFCTPLPCVIISWSGS